MSTVSVVCRIRCGRRGFDRSRCRGWADHLRKRVQMIVVAIVMSDARVVVFGFCAGRRMVVVLQTRSHSDSCGGSDHGAGAEEHNRVGKGRYRLCLVASVPHPASSHHDVDLEQQCAKAGGLYQFGFSGVWTERRSRGPRQGPKGGGTDIGRDPSGEYCRSRPSHTTRAQISWSSAIETKNSPDGIHSCQCVGTTAKWITAAPSEAIAARRAASLLSVFFAALGAIRPMMTWPVQALMK